MLVKVSLWKRRHLRASRQQTQQTLPVGTGSGKSSHLPEEASCTTRETMCYRITYFCKAWTHTDGKTRFSAGWAGLKLPMWNTSKAHTATLTLVASPSSKTAPKVLKHTCSRQPLHHQVCQNKSQGQGSVSLHFLHSWLLSWFSLSMSNLFVSTATGEPQCTLLGTAGPDPSTPRGRDGNSFTLQPNKWTRKRKET